MKMIKINLSLYNQDTDMYNINLVANWLFEKSPEEYEKEWIEFHNEYDVVDIRGTRVKRGRGSKGTFDVEHSILLMDSDEFYYISNDTSAVGLFYLRYNNDSGRTVDVLPIFSPDAEWFEMLENVVEFIKDKNKVRFMIMDYIVMGHHKVVIEILSPYFHSLDTVKEKNNGVYIFRLREDYKKELAMDLHLLRGGDCSRSKSFHGGEYSDKEVSRFARKASVTIHEKEILLTFDPIVYHDGMFGSDDQYFHLFLNGKKYEALDSQGRRMNKISKLSSWTYSNDTYRTRVCFVHGFKINLDEKGYNIGLDRFLLSYSIPGKKRLPAVKSKPLLFPLSRYSLCDLFSEDSHKVYIRPEPISIAELDEVKDAYIAPPKEKSYLGIDTENKVSYLYLIRTREFLCAGHKVYKIGMTTQSPDIKIKRFHGGYPKGSEICLLLKVPGDKVALLEKAVIKKFNEVFTRHADGTEYFEGDMDHMMNLIYSIAMLH